MSETNKQAFNRSDLNTLADLLRKFAFGDVMRALPTTIRKSATAVVASAGADPVVSAQGQDAPAAMILGGYARSGAGAAGPLAVVAFPPAAPNDVAIAPNGSIVTLLADAWTSVDVSYIPVKGDIVEVTGNVAANVLTLPANVTSAGAVMLLEAEALAAGSTGLKFVDVIGAAPAAGEAALNLALTQVAFAGADAVTKARVKVLVCSAVDVNALLEAVNTAII
jgi:hypothetical protein